MTETLSTEDDSNVKVTFQTASSQTLKRKGRLPSGRDAGIIQNVTMLPVDDVFL